MSSHTVHRSAVDGWKWVVAAAVLTVLAAIDAILIATVVGRSGPVLFDQPVHDWFIHLRTPDGGALVTGFTNLGRAGPMIVFGLLLTATLFVHYRRRTIWVLMLVTPIGSVALTEGLKALFARPRPPYTDAVPPYELSASFPSGHTLNSTAVAGMLAYLTWWLARRLWVKVAAIITAVLWIVVMGLSRVYLGHHWPTDVACGWALGLTWLGVVILAHRLWLARVAPRDDPSPTEAGRQ